MLLPSWDINYQSVNVNFKVWQTCKDSVDQTLKGGRSECTSWMSSPYIPENSQALQRQKFSLNTVEIENRYIYHSGSPIEEIRQGNTCSLFSNVSGQNKLVCHISSSLLPKKVTEPETTFWVEQSQSSIHLRVVGIYWRCMSGYNVAALYGSASTAYLQCRHNREAKTKLKTLKVTKGY